MAVGPLGYYRVIQANDCPLNTWSNNFTNFVPSHRYSVNNFFKNNLSTIEYRERYIGSGNLSFLFIWYLIEKFCRCNATKVARWLCSMHIQFKAARNSRKNKNRKRRALPRFSADGESLSTLTRWFWHGFCFRSTVYYVMSKADQQVHQSKREVLGVVVTGQRFLFFDECAIPAF